MNETGINHGFIDLVKSGDERTEGYITIFRPVQYSRWEQEASDMIAGDLTLDLYSPLPTTCPIPKSAGACSRPPAAGVKKVGVGFPLHRSIRDELSHWVRIYPSLLLTALFLKSACASSWFSAAGV